MISNFMEKKVDDIELSKHLLQKIRIMKSHSFEVSPEMIKDTIRFPDEIEQGYKGRVIAQKILDDKHVIRVVYEKHDEKILVVTVYPGKRSRYEKN